MEILISDFGGAQEEAVGMAAASASMVFLDVSVPVVLTGTGIVATAVDATVPVVLTGTGIVATAVDATVPVVLAGTGIVATAVDATVPVVLTGTGIVATAVDASIPISVLGHGIDFASPAKSYFFITAEGMLEPLGVLVLRGSRHDLMPDVRNRTISIPGRHGVYDFGSEFGQRSMTILAASRGHIDTAQRAQIKHALAKHLNPFIGKQPLIFADDIDKTYMVKCAGQIDTAIFKSWLEFTIPFTGDPIIVGSFEKQHVGSGFLVNEGTFEAPVKIRIEGSATNPAVTIGGEVVSWTGIMTANDVLEIDTENMSVTLNSINALANYTGGFPQIQPGETAVTAAAAETIWRWRDRWI